MDGRSEGEDQGQKGAGSGTLSCLLHFGFKGFRRFLASGISAMPFGLHQGVWGKS